MIGDTTKPPEAMPATVPNHATATAATVDGREQRGVGGAPPMLVCPEVGWGPIQILVCSLLGVPLAFLILYVSLKNNKITLFILKYFFISRNVAVISDSGTSRALTGARPLPTGSGDA